jgi:hypothetical protein
MFAESLADHLNIVATSFLKGYVTPLLGAGVNLSVRPEGYQWCAPAPGQPAFLPSGKELANYIASQFHYTGGPAAAAAVAASTSPESAVAGAPAAPHAAPAPDFDLMHISQVAEIDHGAIPLIQSLSGLFANAYPVSHIHRFLCRIPQILAAEPPSVRYQLIMTTNYDNLMELAFQEVGQDYDLVWYEAEGRSRGTFVHQAPGKSPVSIPPDYGYPFFEQRPVVLKLHGTVIDRTRGSYVITEDHYIQYTARIDDRALPKTLTARWVNFLYLGYALRDFNLRVVVRRLQESDGMSRVSWAILRNPSASEVRYWQRNSVELISMDLAEYLAQLETTLRTLARPPG